MKKYIVRDGDTMWSISKATGVRMNLLLAANPQLPDPNKLQPGQILAIPELDKPSMPPTAAKPSAPPTPAPPSTAAPGAVAGQGQMPAYFGPVWPHVVQGNESWDSIAKQYSVPASVLKELNPRKQMGALQTGDIVYVPFTQGGTAGVGWSGTAPQMPQMPQMPGGGMPPWQGQPAMGPMPGGGMPPWQGQPAMGPMPGGGMMPPWQVPAPGMTGQPPVGNGQHTHLPPRGQSPGAYTYYTPYVAVPRGYPQYGYSPQAPGRVPPYAAPYGAWQMGWQYPRVPSAWYTDWDDSSSWESSWEPGDRDATASISPSRDPRMMPWPLDGHHDDSSESYGADPGNHD